MVELEKSCVIMLETKWYLEIQNIFSRFKNIKKKVKKKLPLFEIIRKNGNSIFKPDFYSLSYSIPKKENTIQRFILLRLSST